MMYKNPEEKMEPSLKLDGENENNYRVTSKEDKIIDFVRWNQSIEGFDMPPEDEKECRRIIKGEITVEESIDRFLTSHGLKR